MAIMSQDMLDLDPVEVQERMEKEEDIEEEVALITECVAGIQMFGILRHTIKRYGLRFLELCLAANNFS